MPSPWIAHYTLSLLAVIYALNYLDRNIFSIVLQSIKEDMLLSDTTLGLLGGLAFAMFYATLGVPIAWLADRYSRRNIITIGLTVWSLMTALTGMVTQVWQLAATRFLMGAGEACGTAPSNSMLADLYDKYKRPLALSILTSGSTVGTFLGYLLGGWINELYGWRMVYFVAGVPGVFVAILFWLTVKEPQRGASETGKPSLAVSTFRETMKFLTGSKTYTLVVIGGCLMAVHIFGNAVWYPTFLERVHGLASGEIGTYLSLARGPIGVLGIFTGGFLAERLGRRDERWRIWIPALGCILAAPAELLFLFADTLWLSIAGMVAAGFFTAMHLGPVYAILMAVAKVRMRAVATAAFLLCTNLVGQALGPLGIGFMNDVLSPAYGNLAIRYSLLLGPLSGLLAGWLIWMGSRYVVRDVGRATASE